VRRFAGGLTLGLVLAWAALALSQGTPAPGAFRIQDAGFQGFARVTHYGALMVSIVGGDWGLETQDVNIRHINTVVHVTSAGLAPLNQALAVRCVNISATAFEACGGGGPGGSDAVNVFHQSTVAHVSSVTHVAGRVILTNVAGTPVTLTGGALDVNCTGCAAASVVAISHISAAVHLAGGVTDNANQALRVSGVTVFTVQGAIGHISSVTHVAGAVGQGGAWTVNVGHLSGQLHIAAIHASGALRAWRVESCGTAAKTVIATNTARRELWLTNMGTSNIYIGYGAAGHVAVSTSNGWPMHAASASTGLAYPVKLREYVGPIACVTDLGSQQLGIMEVLRN